MSKREGGDFESQFAIFPLKCAFSESQHLNCVLVAVCNQRDIQKSLSEAKQLGRHLSEQTYLYKLAISVSQGCCHIVCPPDSSLSHLSYSELQAPISAICSCQQVRGGGGKRRVNRVLAQQRGLLSTSTPHTPHHLLTLPASLPLPYVRKSENRTVLKTDRSCCTADDLLWIFTEQS